MQVNIQKLSPVLVEFAVEIPEPEVRREVERAYKELARTAKVRGFRPGKAPRDVLAHMFSGQVTANVAQRLVDETLPRALAEKSVQPLMTLSISPSKLNLGSAFSYRARFEVSPDIDAVKYDGFEVKRPALEVPSKVLDSQLESLRQEHATLKSLETPRPARAGDQVILDFNLEVDGKSVGEAESHDVEAVVGAGKLLKELEQSLEGSTAGDKKDVNVTFAPDHPRAELRGKTGVFHVTIKDVKERLLPDLDDDFAKDVGEFETLDALKSDLRAKAEKVLKQQADEAVAEQLVVELCKANPIPVPPSLVKRQAEITEQELMQQARQRRERLQMNDELRERVRLDSEIKVRAGLLMAAIARSNGISINDQDIEAAYVELADQTGKNVARLKAEYRDPKKREILIGMILEDKILDLLEGKATVTTEAAAAAEAPAAAEAKPAGTA